jgi:nitric oxide dioxygenase
MDQKTIDIIKATAGVVGGHAEEITKLFYKTMFANSPTARTFFNAANQVCGLAHTQYACSPNHIVHLPVCVWFL